MTTNASSNDVFANLLNKQDEIAAASQVEQAASQLEVLKNRARLMGITFSNNIGVEALRAKIAAKQAADEQAQESANAGHDDGDDDTGADTGASDGADGDGTGESQDPVAIQEAGPTAPAKPAVAGTQDLSALHALASVLGLKLVPANATMSSGVEGALSPRVNNKVVAPSPLAISPELRKQQFQEQMKLVRVRITNLDPKKKNVPGEIFCVANKVLGAVKKYIPYGEATDNGYHIPFFLYQELVDRKFLDIRTTKDNRGRTVVKTGWVREFAIEVLPALTQQEISRLAQEQAAKAGVSD